MNYFFTVMAWVGIIQTGIVSAAAGMILYIVLKADDPKAEVVNASVA